MARARKAGEATPLPPTRGPTDTPLYALLTARKFRLGASTERVARNLAQHGGTVAGDAAAWIGAARPPDDAPSVGLGASPARSGRAASALNVMGGSRRSTRRCRRCRAGRARRWWCRRAMRCPTLGPLALARGLGSPGSSRSATAIRRRRWRSSTPTPPPRRWRWCSGTGATGASLRSVLGAKPAVVWGGDGCVARWCAAGAWSSSAAGGAVVVSGARGAVRRRRRAGAALEVMVVGGGRAYVDDEVRAAALDARVVAVDERADELDQAIARRPRSGRWCWWRRRRRRSCRRLKAHSSCSADLRHPEHLRALLLALAAPAAERRAAHAAGVDKELAAKRAHRSRGHAQRSRRQAPLKAYGARVTRQAPTHTPTGAVKLAKQIGVPCIIAIGGRGARRRQRRRRQAHHRALAARPADGDLPSVMVRERFPEVPRARLKIAPKKGSADHAHRRRLRAFAADPADALGAGRRDSGAPRRRPDAVAELLAKIPQCAVDENASLGVASSSSAASPPCSAPAAKSSAAKTTLAVSHRASTWSWLRRRGRGATGSLHGEAGA